MNGFIYFLAVAFAVIFVTVSIHTMMKIETMKGEIV